MSMLYIVEGPDCAGKTTLAKAIAHRKKLAYWHMSGAKQLHDGMWEYHWTTMQTIAYNISCGIGFVIDRLWLSELVYAREFRPSLIGRYDFDKMQALIKDLQGHHILCMDDEIEDRHEEQRDQNHPYNRADFHNIVVAYGVAFGCVPQPWTPYDVTKFGAVMNDYIDALP
jgi:hypothetical protein